MWNNLKTTVLLAGLTGLLLAIGQWWGGQRGLTFALVLAAVMNLGSYFFSDKIALKSSGAQPISREDGPRIYAIVERLAAKANVPVPKIYMIPTDSPNAFATGRNPNHASVAVTRGILQICNDQEIEGVLRVACKTEQVAAVPWPLSNGNADGIVAFITASETANGQQILENCREVLPDYMIPRKIYRLEEMPLNSNGKIDRKTLSRYLLDGVCGELITR